jgi:2-dehydro-3-deoxyphosphogluconate aldolase/(4S)-4-hydroxy-2-oxoglutarate aldolase
VRRIQVIQNFHRTGLVPLFYHSDPDVGKHILSACYAGGARVIEFTNRGDFAHQVFSELSQYAAIQYPDLALGVGSVIDAGTASLYLQLGADFIVSPMLVEEIAPVCNRRKVLFAPGCGSLTEITRAHELGCELVKLFPGGVYGPKFIKAVLGPCPWASIMPTGGVSPTEDNLRQWFEAGAVCVGMGSKLITAELVADGDFEGLEKKVEETLEVIQAVRQSGS